MLKQIREKIREAQMRNRQIESIHAPLKEVLAELKQQVANPPEKLTHLFGYPFYDTIDNWVAVSYK